MPQGMHEFESDPEGFSTKSYCLDNGSDAVVFDAQFTPEWAQKSLEHFKAQGVRNTQYLVITQPSAEKFNGAGTFKAVGAEVVASQDTQTALEGVQAYKKNYFVNTVKMFTEETYPRLTHIDVTFSDTYALELFGGTNIELRELHMGAAASNHTVAHIPSSNALIVGDLIHHRTHAWLEGPIVNGQTAYSTAAWVAALDKLLELYPADVMVYAGRGQKALLSEAVAVQKEYLQKAESLAREYVESLAGANLAEKKSKVDYGELTKKFEAAFPDYLHSFLVTRSAYGLVMSL